MKVNLIYKYCKTSQWPFQCHAYFIDEDGETGSYITLGSSEVGFNQAKKELMIKLGELKPTWEKNPKIPKSEEVEV